MDMQNEEKKVKKGFFKGMKMELKKVIWPTGKQTVKSTFITIVFVLLISAVLIVLNLFFNFISEKWYDVILDREGTITESGDVSGDASGEALNDVSDENIIIPEELLDTAQSGETGVTE